MIVCLFGCGLHELIRRRSFYRREMEMIRLMQIRVLGVEMKMFRLFPPQLLKSMVQW